jgi:hypothetical protein
MEDPLKEFDYVKARTSTIEEQIEIAFGLVAEIDFQKLLETSILKDDYTPLKLKLSYGSFQLINEARERHLKSQEFAFKVLLDRSASKLELQNQLGDLASWIISYYKIIDHIKSGNHNLVKYSLIGMAWAKCETLIKYHEILLNFGKPQPETDLIPDHIDKSTLKNDFYTETCRAFNCNSFFEFLNKSTDLEELGRNLEEQLKLYARRCGEGFEKPDANKGDLS